MTTERDADGYVIVHNPADGTDAYCIGPFPPILDLVQLVRDRGRCTCQRVIMPVGFPAGLKMAMAIDPEAMAKGIALLLVPEGEADRLN
jgi:hypothetical protein